MYLPDRDFFSDALVMQAHEETQYRGVEMIIAAELPNTTCKRFGKEGHKPLRI